MAIWGIEGGIGTGKTLSLVYFGIVDLQRGRQIYSNIKFKGLPRRSKVKYLTKDMVNNIFQLIKDGVYDMRNSTVLIQEAHNYLDSRNSQSKKNKALSYWILQSRHTGEGSCDIMYDTQDFGQVDLRLRRNTDYFIRPFITERIGDTPSEILLQGRAKIMHKWTQFSLTIQITDYLKYYDTHEIVDF